MSSETECEIARSGDPGITDGEDSRRLPGARTPPRWPLRTVLRAEDGVAIEAAYTPWSGPSDPSDNGDAHRADSAVPVIVVAHGFTGAVDRPALRRAAETFAWVERGFGHAENAAPPQLLERVARWAVARA